MLNFYIEVLDFDIEMSDIFDIEVLRSTSISKYSDIEAYFDIEAYLDIGGDKVPDGAFETLKT